MKFFKGIGSILSFFTSILIFIISFVIIIFCTVTSFLEEKNVKSIINAEFVLNIKYENESVKDLFVKNNKFDLDKKILEDIVNSNEFINMFDEVIDDTIDYYLYDKDYPDIDKKYEDFVNNISKKHDNEKIKDILLNEKNIIQIPKKDEEQSSRFNAIINNFDFYNIYYVCGFILIFMFLIFIFNWSLSKPFKYAGISFITSSTMCICLYFSKFLLIKEEVFSSYEVIINNVFDLLLKYSIICLGAGVLFIIIYIILNTINSRKISIGDECADIQNVV